MIFHFSNNAIIIIIGITLNECLCVCVFKLLKRNKLCLSCIRYFAAIKRVFWFLSHTWTQIERTYTIIKTITHTHTHTQSLWVSGVLTLLFSQEIAIT